MRRWLVAILALAVVATTAIAMDQTSVPRQFPIPWGSSATPSYIRVIPEASQIGSQNCAASLTDGFPPLTFTPSSQGGCPPFGQDMNGILKQLSQWSQWQGAGAHPLYDSSFSTSIAGYPSGAVLANASTPGCYWVSTVDANTSDPDTGGANWNASCPGGGIGATSGGSANVQTLTVTGFVVKRGQGVTFTAGFTNTSLLQVNINGAGNVAVWRKTQLGTSATAGGEIIAGQLVRLVYDGTRYQCESCQTVRVGQSIDFRGTSAPAGTMVEDGSAVSRTTYADLFSVIGTTYGVGDGSTTFNLPDSRGRVTAGADGGTNRITTNCSPGSVGTACGGQNSTITQTNLPSGALSSGVSIKAPDGNPILVVSTASPGTAVVGGSPGPAVYAGVVYQNNVGSITLGGSDTPISSMQPTLVATKAIQF